MAKKKNRRKVRVSGYDDTGYSSNRRDYDHQSSYSSKKDMVPYYDLKPIRPKNELQQKYINALKEHSIVLSTGVAGTGKTYLAAVTAADMLLDPSNPIEKIILARPNCIEGTATIGLLPGTKDEKMAPWVAPVAEAIKDRIGKGRYEMFLKNETIELLPLEYIKGRTFNNAFVIIDEAEDIEYSVLKTLLLRKGIDSKIVIDGDIRQTSLRFESGLAKLMRIIDAYELPVCHVDFPSWDYCVRSKEVALMGATFEEAEKSLGIRALR